MGKLVEAIIEGKGIYQFYSSFFSTHEHQVIEEIGNQDLCNFVNHGALAENFKVSSLLKILQAELSNIIDSGIRYQSLYTAGIKFTLRSFSGDTSYSDLALNKEQKQNTHVRIVNQIDIIINNKNDLINVIIILKNHLTADYLNKLSPEELTCSSLVTMQDQQSHMGRIVKVIIEGNGVYESYSSFLYINEHNDIIEIATNQPQISAILQKLRRIAQNSYRPDSLTTNPLYGDNFLFNLTVHEVASGKCANIKLVLTSSNIPAIIVILEGILIPQENPKFIFSSATVIKVAKTVKTISIAEPKPKLVAAASIENTRTSTSLQPQKKLLFSTVEAKTSTPISTAAHKLTAAASIEKNTTSTSLRQRVFNFLNI